jgi:hypothetical protein
MNQTIIIIIVVVLALCLCGCVVGYIALRIGGQAVAENMVVSDPEEVGAAASEIAEYDLPAGYKEEGVVNFLFGKMVMISPMQRHNHNAGHCVDAVIGAGGGNGFRADAPAGTESGELIASRMCSSSTWGRRPCRSTGRK